TLINYDFGGMGTSDAVIRDIRTRVGDMNDTATGGMGLGSCNHCIIDHCSISWATDEGFSSRSAGNITFQWNIIGESLNNSVHYDANDRNKTERHAFAASISGFTGSFHHNLLVNNTGRNWSLAGAMEQDAVTYGGQLDISNNVVYNWRDRTTDGGVRRLNFVNNYYKAGPVSNTELHIVSLDGNELNTSDMQKMYVSGNVMTNSDGSYILKSTDNAWDKGKAKSGGKNSTNSDVRSDSPFFENHITLQSAEDAYAAVVNNTTGAGANIPKLDYIDSRYHNEVQKGTYTYTGSKDGLKGIIDSQNDVGGYPNSSNFKGGTAPVDTDKDGMPDNWENEHGLNPNDASDGSIVSLSADDYTNLEMYLNELAGDPVVFNGNVKTIDAFSQIEAESFDSQEGIKVQECGDENGGEQVAYVENGDYLLFKNVDFTDGAKSFTARLAGKTAAIELYLDKLGDTPAAVLDFSGAGNWTDWETISCNISKITGKHNVYIRFTGGEGYLVNLNWFTFSKDAVALNGKYINGLTVNDETNAANWKLSSAPAVGGVVFGDRPAVSYVTVPDGLDTAETILTACDSKNTTDPTDMAVFMAKEAVTVYVGLDSRVENVPSWMGDYTKTQLISASSNDVTFVLYSKDFEAGETATLGSNEQSYQCMNYVVYVTAKADVPEPTEATIEPAPTETEPTESQPTPSDTSDTTEPSETGTILYGDTNVDGKVDIMDVILLNRNLMIGAEISEQGILNADVDDSGNVDAVDSLNILKAVVQLITLPIA
ncbi:MAG: carbohydrate-binding protein, partial [Oscillospiraceae bacterium]|nr:carbohydrate-binding protein [Oscillospiraceae bacterium]